MNNRWQTKIEMDNPGFTLDYHTRLMAVGSCFAENIGKRLAEGRFAIDLNPCGIVYNPVSVAHVLERLIDEHLWTEKELIWNDGKWVSFGHHGSFSSADRTECLSKINGRLQQGRACLQRAGLLLITWGTSWVYRYRPDGKIVSNCHKFPAGDFDRFRLSVAEITACYEHLLDQLRQLNPDLKVLFTVSPVRHWKDGAHGNQLSKSVLLLAIEQLMERREQVYYFPAYEIVMDELRDYRFYAEDMLHISEPAVDYIWTRFQETFFSPQTRDALKRVEKINKGLTHRPFDPDGETYRLFREKLRQDWEELKKQYPLMTGE